MSWTRKTILRPQEFDIVACDGCGEEAENLDETWSKVSFERGATIFHFCARCRGTLLNLLREGFRRPSEALKAAGSTPAPTLTGCLVVDPASPAR